MLAGKRLISRRVYSGSFTQFSVTRYLIRPYSTERNYGRDFSYLHALGKEALQYTTVGKMLERSANKWPGNTAIVSKQENLSITYCDLLEKADNLAASFKELGLERGDRLGLWAPNTFMWNIIKLAACRAGIILAAINPVYQPPEIEFCVNKVGIKALIAPESFKNQKYYDIIRGLAPELGKCQPGQLNSAALPTLKSLIILSDKEFPGAYNTKSLGALANSSNAQRISAEQDLINPDDGCNIQFTSGTTGEPKAALLTHMNIVNNSFYIGKRKQLDSNSKVCVQVPLFHAFAVVISCMSAFQYGANVVIPALQYNPKANLDAILSERCTIAHGTPTMYVDLVAEVAKNPTSAPTFLQSALCAGAPCSPHLVKTIKQKLNTKTVTMLYGMTELTGCAFIGIPEESFKLTCETVGKIQEHLEAKVVDSEGRMVPFGQPGELWIRGYSVMLGYWGDEKRTRDTINESRWLKTGDTMVLFENGYGKIVGRKKDMIIRGGENVYPKEIEDFLNTHPAIMESHVFGTSHKRLGEEVCAAVKIKEGASLTEEEFKSFCEGKLVYFKIPKHIKFVTSFPKTLSGKIQKFKLREMMESGKL